MSLNGSDQDPWSKPKQNGQSSENNTSDQNEGRSNWDRSSNSQKDNQQSPPDLEDIFNNLLKKLFLNQEGGESSSSSSLMKIFDKIEIEIDKQKLQTAIIAMSAMIIGYYLQRLTN